MPVEIIETGIIATIINLLSFLTCTDHYADYPLAIQGPGF